MRVKQCNDVFIDFDKVVAVERAYNLNGALSGAIIHVTNLISPIRVYFTNPDSAVHSVDWMTPAQAEEPFSFILKLWKAEQ